MGYSKWEILKCSNMGAHNFYFFFNPFENFLIIGVKEFKIIEHRFPIWVEHLYNFLVLLFVIFLNPSNQCHCSGLSVLSDFTIESRCCSSKKVFFGEEYPRVVVQWILYFTGPSSLHKRSTKLTSMITSCYKTYNVMVYIAN